MIAERLKTDPCGYHLAVFSGRINDVWRRFQGRPDEAMGIEEYEANYSKALTMLAQGARQVLCLTETPVELATDAAMNAEPARYNAVAARVAKELGMPMLDIWPLFLTQAESRRLSGAPSLWSDGVHLSEDGDATMVMFIGNAFHEDRIIELSYDSREFRSVYVALDTAL